MARLGRIIELWRYPVSSMGGERLEASQFDDGGLPGDRIWGVIDARDGTIAGPEKRRHWRPLPELSARSAAPAPEISSADDRWVAIDTAQGKARLTDFLGFPAEAKPHTPYETEEAGHVAPRYRRDDLHILTTASLDALAELLGQPEQVKSIRFRPNVVIETGPQFSGFAEHGLVGRRLSVGGGIIKINEPCARCTFTAIAQKGLAFEPAILQTIARHGEGGFGVLCSVEQAGTMRLGDEVELLD